MRISIGQLIWRLWHGWIKLGALIRWVVAKSCTTLEGWNPINNGINMDKPPFSTGAGIRNHPRYVSFSPTFQPDELTMGWQVRTQNQGGRVFRCFSPGIYNEHPSHGSIQYHDSWPSLLVLVVNLPQNSVMFVQQGWISDSFYGDEIWWCLNDVWWTW